MWLISEGDGALSGRNSPEEAFVLLSLIRRIVSSAVVGG